MIRTLCYEHHVTEFDALPNSRRHEASSWTTVAKEDCAECKRLAELQPALDALRIEELEAEVERLQRELYDEQVRRDEWEKMYNRAVADAAPSALPRGHPLKIHFSAPEGYFKEGYFAQNRPEPDTLPPTCRPSSCEGHKEEAG